jgi:hypothetical protein
VQIMGMLKAVRDGFCEGIIVGIIFGIHTWLFDKLPQTFHQV